MNTVTPTSASCQTDSGTLSFQVAADTLDEAWSWLCRSRENAPDHADIWALRHCWAQTGDALLAQLLSGTYRLTPMLITGRGRKKKEAQALWSARDALVLKWVALIIAPQLAIPVRCEHVKGHGGGPSSVARMTRSLVQHRWGWVCRTDVRGYYGSMNKQKLLACVFHQIQQPVLRSLITQYVHYTVEYGGEFHTPEKGIARGCALSPLMGALYLAQMDMYFSEQAGMYYARYMDDVVILAKTRWQLRRHVRALNRFFEAGEVEQHPDKTFIGRTERGFDWMGAQMGEHGVEGIAQRAKVNHRERLRRLYERFSRRPAEGRMRMSAYRRRWKIWAMMGFGVLQMPYAGAATRMNGGVGDVFHSGYAPSIPIVSSTSGDSIWEGSTPVVTGGIAGSAATRIIPQIRLPWVVDQISPSTGRITATSVEVADAGSCTATSGWGASTPLTLSGTYAYWGNSKTFPIYQGPNQVGPGAGPLNAGVESNTYNVNTPGLTNDQTVAVVGKDQPIASVSPGCRVVRISATYPGQAVGARFRATAEPGWLMLTNGNPCCSRPYFTMGLSLAAGGTKEFTIGNLPNCTALTVTYTSVSLSSSSGVVRPLGGSGTMVKTDEHPNSFGLTCTGNAAYPVGATATVFGGTDAQFVAGDPRKLAFSDPGLYLSLLAPAAWPSGVSASDGQSSGQALLFGTLAAPRPLWDWALPGTPLVTTNPVTLTPKVFLSGSNWSTNYGDKKVTVRFTTNIQ